MIRTLCISLALFGCTSPPHISSMSQGPATQSTGSSTWIDDFVPPNQDLYGVGAGPSLAVATRSALAEAAATLSVSISDDLELYAQQIGDQSLEQVKRELTSHVAELQVREWEKLKSTRVDGTYYALVRIDRKRLVGDLRYEIDSLWTTLRSRLQPPSEISTLLFWAAYRESFVGLARAQEIGILLTGLDPTFDGDALRKKLLSWQQRYELGLGSLEFGVAGRGQMLDVAGVVENLLTDAQLRVSDSQSCRVGEGVCIEVTGSITNRMIRKKYLSVIRTSWILHDESGRMISMTPHQYTGNSRIGQQAAEQDAHSKMYKDLSQGGGIESALGF